MKAKLLHNEDLGLEYRNRSPKIKVHHYEYGMNPEIEMPYPDKVYLRNGIKVARTFEGGFGNMAKHAIFHLR